MTLRYFRADSTSRRRGFVLCALLCAPCSEAWVSAPPGGCAKSVRRCYQQQSFHRNACGRRRPPPPSARGSSSSAQAALSRSADDDLAEGTAPPSPPPQSEKFTVVAVETGFGEATGRGASWKERFASLRNDAADPWTARCADYDSSSEQSTTGSAPAAVSLGNSSNGEDSSVQEQAPADGGASAREEVARVEPPRTAMATALPEETGTSSTCQRLTCVRYILLGKHDTNRAHMLC